MYGVLGWLNIALLAVITSPLWLRKLNGWVFHIPMKKFGRVLKVLRTLHKPLGIALVVIIPIHGFLALGGIRLHTGTVAWAAGLAVVCVGLLYFFLRKPALLKTHRWLALAFVALAVVHLLFPWALS